MTKIAYNDCFGGFGLSYKAVMRYAELSGVALYGFVSARKKDGSTDFKKLVPVDPKTVGTELFVLYYTTPTDSNDSSWRDISLSRTDPILIRVIEELGDAANGLCAKLAIAEVAEGSKYRIDEYDGNESVMTVDSYDWSIA
jgi:hypothetical protein